MSSSRVLALTIAMMTASVVPARAQHRGTVELGGFARYGKYDTDLGLDDAAGWGGRLGFFLSDKVLLEGDGALAPTKASGADVDHVPVHVRLLGNLPIAKRMAFLIGGGWAYNKFSKGFTGTENGVGALAGLRLNLGQRVSVRGEGLADYMFDHAGSNGATLHYAVQAGVSVQLWGGPGDKDHDGVTDNLDKCPDTPKGTRVEATGCPDTDGDGVADQVDRCPNTPAGRAVDAIGCTDEDGDGVVDPQDRCPNTPKGTQVDATGCPVDTDRDGVPDISDKCPNTPAGVRVDVTGCPVDSDGDGVPDSVDKCPGTPPGTAVDATGCAPDADGDGVPDAADKCPGTPAGTAVDATGCPAAAAVTVLEGVTFLSGSAKLTLNSQGPLNRAVQGLQQRPDVRVVIEGHTDNVGNRDANIRLSKARADAVRAYFISKGVAASRLTSVGLGPDQPIAPNDTPEGRTKNRRVQLRDQP
ncbi:MAG TPA: thrombospondin type 3 repeat-containing protein [Gemmatimonadales bacterium]|nr:thrombospondin type 3 repeat-containing protein [Gemmatimonadales bacterium]